MSDGIKLLQDMSKTLRTMANSEVVYPLSGDNGDKVQSLKQQGRDFFLINKTAEEAFARGMQKALDKDPEALDSQQGKNEVLKAGADEFRRLVVDRFEKGGGDVPVRPLKAATIAVKGSSKVGVDTGALLQSVRTCKPIVR